MEYGHKILDIHIWALKTGGSTKTWTHDPPSDNNNVLIIPDNWYYQSL